MGGKLYGIGVGPGDPELLTLKAVNTIKECDVIALPKAGSKEKTAFKIAEKYLGQKEVLECAFSMEKEEGKRRAARVRAAADICRLLEQGKTVGFITLGDPTVYSTYMYVHRLVAEKGFSTRIIPGVPSFTAAAAALNTSLCEGSEVLHIIPASRDMDKDRLTELLELKGNKIIMKSGLSDIYAILEQEGLSGKAKVVERCTMEGERIFNAADAPRPKGGTEYFSVIIIKED